MSGIKDVAKRAGVSISTVSNVLNETRYVSPELAEKVRSAVNELSYEVDPIARSLKSNKTRTIGIITADICGMFYPYIIKGIASIAETKGYQMIICDAKGIYGDTAAIQRERKIFKNLISNRVDGIVFVSTVGKDERAGYLSKLLKLAKAQKNIALVSLERDLTNYGIDSVYFDGFENSKKAVQHLVDCGCKKIGHIAGPKSMEIVEERCDGYLEAMLENKQEVEPDSMIIYGDYTHQSGYTAMKQLLVQEPEVDGVFCGNDQMAIGALKLLKECGKRVPQDIKLMGYDDVFISSVVEPAISTIHIRKRHAGIKAAKLLFEKIENQDDEKEPIGIKMEGRLVVRKSTVTGAPEDWILSDW